MSAMLAVQLNRRVPFCHAKESFFFRAGEGVLGGGGGSRDFVNQPPGPSRPSREEEGELGKKGRSNSGEMELGHFMVANPLNPR